MPLPACLLPVVQTLHPRPVPPAAPRQAPPVQALLAAARPPVLQAPPALQAPRAAPPAHPARRVHPATAIQWITAWMVSRLKPVMPPWPAVSRPLPKTIKPTW